MIIRNLELEARSHTPTSAWAESTLTALRQRSPISLHVSLAAMRATEGITRYHTFQREYELASKFMRQPDFVNGVTARLIQRSEPQWSLPPATLENSQEWVREEIIEKGGFEEPLEESFYMLEEGKRENVAKMMERGLFKYSLPTEAGVLATLLKGKVDGICDETRYTRKELVEYIVGEHLGKAGAERKLNFILDRKSVVDVNGTLVWKFDDSQTEK